MLETIQIPLLLKAIDFVFDEGRKILEERRERRKLNSAPPETEDPQPATEVIVPKPEEIIEIKQDLLGTKIDELLWQNHEAEVQHLVKLLETHTKSYYILKEQYAKWGSALVPPVIMSQVEERENSILETRKRLEIVLSKVYKRELPSIQ